QLRQRPVARLPRGPRERLPPLPSLSSFWLRIRCNLNVSEEVALLHLHSGTVIRIKWVLKVYTLIAPGRPAGPGIFRHIILIFYSHGTWRAWPAAGRDTWHRFFCCTGSLPARSYRKRAGRSASSRRP